MSSIPHSYLSLPHLPSVSFTLSSSPLIPTPSHPLHISWTYVSLSINSSCQSSSLFHFLQYSFPSSSFNIPSIPPMWIDFPAVCFFSFLLSCSHPFHTSFIHYPVKSCYPCSFILSSSSPPLPIPTPSYSYTHFPSFHLNHLHLYLSFI